MDRHETLSFGAEIGDPFRLEIRLGSAGFMSLKLFHKELEVSGAFDRNLKLLKYLAERAKTEVHRNDILDAICLGGTFNTVDKYIFDLRKLLGDVGAKPKFIETISGIGYKFMLDVQREGDLGIDAYPKWSPARFYELLSTVKRGREDETEDIRISTTGISTSLEALDLKGLLRRHLRIKILFMNPENKPLKEARYGLREDKAAKRAMRELDEQVEEVQKLARQHSPGAVDPLAGSLDYGLSDAMPCGFVVHTKNWAVLAVFLAHDSYTAGPMIEIQSHSEAWETLHTDWKTRWNAAHAAKTKTTRKR